MDERPDKAAFLASSALVVAILAISTIATWAAPPDDPGVEAPTITIVAQFDSTVQYLPGWTLVDAEPVWRISYFPGRNWHAVNATESELRAAYTHPDGRVDHDALETAQGRLMEAVRVTCRYTPLNRATVGAD